MTRIMRKTSNGFEEIFNSSTIANLTRRIETLESKWNSLSRAGASSPTIQWARLGKLVVIAGRCVVTTASKVTVMTLPAGSRPAVHAESPTVTGGYAGANVDGTVVVSAKPGNNFFTLCFPAA